MTPLKAFEEVAREAAAALGLTPVEHFITHAPTIDAVIVRAWVELGKTFVKVYADHELVVLAATDKGRKPVRDLLKYDLERARPIRVEDL